MNVTSTISFVTNSTDQWDANTETIYSVNSTNKHYTNETIASLEELEWEDFVKKDIPVTVFLIVLSIVGTIGNFHSLLVYYLHYKASNHRTFIICLSGVDLMACIFSIPFEIIDARYSLTFYNVGACKVFRYLGHFVSLCSGFLLGDIAADRYRKICKHDAKQLGTKQAKWVCFITVIVSIVLSIPSLVFYGPTPKVFYEYSLIGSDCRVLTAYKGTVPVRAYNYSLLLMSTVVFILCVVTYSFIGKVIYRQLTYRKQQQQFYKDGHSVNKDISSISNGKTIIEDESSIGQNNKVVIAKQTTITKPAKKFKLDRSKQIALMLLVATAVSYVGYLPHLILIIIKGIKRKLYNRISLSLGSVGPLFIRGYFITHVTNPIVYCFLDEHFKRECRALYSRMKNKLFKS